MWLLPPEYVVLDIETTAGEPIEAEVWARRCWNPSRTWKAVTIGERYLEVVAKKEEQLALLDSAPIISVALKTPAECTVVHRLDVTGIQLPGVSFEACPDERTVLEKVAQFLACCDDLTVLVGHNILGFDLPKLRRRMLACGVRLPRCLVSRDQPVFDTMREWRLFTVDDRAFVGLDEVLECCGLNNHKELLSGAQVPELFAAGRHAEIAAYAAADVLVEWNVFLIMTGQEPSRAAPVPSESPSEQPVVAVEQNGDSQPHVTISPATVVGAKEESGDELQRILKELGV